MGWMVGDGPEETGGRGTGTCAAGRVDRGQPSSGAGSGEAGVFPVLLPSEFVAGRDETLDARPGGRVRRRPLVAP